MSSPILVRESGSFKVNTDHSGESSYDHSVDPFVRPIGEQVVPEMGLEKGNGRSERDETEKMHADSNHQYREQQPGTQADKSSSNYLETQDEVAAFVFRVACPGSSPQRLQLTGDHYTIGTAEGCSIRLRDANVLPLHATLRYSSSRITVEAHTHPVIVNGHAVKHAELNNGDILSLGGYRFELVSNRRIQDRSSQPATLTNALPPDLERAIARSTNKPPEHNRRSTDQQPPAMAESQNLSNLVTQSRLEDCIRRERLAEKREAKIENDLADLKYREEDLTKRLSRIQAEEAASLELYDQLAKRQTEINSLRESLKEKQALHLQRETELQNAKLDLENRLREQQTKAIEQSENSKLSIAKINSLSSELDEIRKELLETQQDRDLIQLREQLQRREHEQLVRQLESDRDRVIAEKAKSQAELRKMEGSIRDLEHLISAANSIDPPPLEGDTSEIGLSESEQDGWSQHEQGTKTETSCKDMDSVAILDPDRPSITSEISTDGHEVQHSDSKVADATQNASDDTTSTNRPTRSLTDSAATLENLDPDSLREYTELSQRNAELLAELMELKRQRDIEKREAAKLVSSVDNTSELEAALENTSTELQRTRTDYAEAISLLQVMREQQKKQQKNHETSTDQQAIAESLNHSHHDSDAGHASPGESTVDLPSRDRPRGESTSGNKKRSGWQSLLRNLGSTPIGEGGDSSAATTESELVGSFVANQESTASAEPSSDQRSQDDDWFQSKNKAGEKPQAATGEPTKKSSSPLRVVSEVDDLFFSSNRQAAAKSTNTSALQSNRDKEQVIWHGQNREALTTAVKREALLESASKTTNHENSIDFTSIEEVENQVDRVLTQADQYQLEDAAHLGSQSTESVNATTSIINMVTHSIGSLFSSSDSTSQRFSANDQIALTRFALAIAAVAAGLLCYRVVPGGIRYVALVMSLILAAIYTSEGFSGIRSRA